MAPPYQKPINSLKRAEDLIALSQKQAALDLLLSVVLSRKIKSAPPAQIEPIMLKFVDLCVELMKVKSLKEGLHQFKGMMQQISVQSAEKIFNRLISFSEEMIQEAKLEAQRLAQEFDEKGEEAQTPELKFLRSASMVTDRERLEHGIVFPWIRFMWDTYRTILDTLKVPNKLKGLYQTVAIKAVTFCKEYNRKIEFGRLCDLLKQHVVPPSKGSKQVHPLTFKDQESAHRHFEIRFLQLSAATELQIWQEVFRAIDDINTLMKTCTEPLKNSVFADFHKELSNILLVGENYPFHSKILLRYYAFMVSNNSLTPEEKVNDASKAVISALASIPQSRTDIRRSTFNESDEETTRVRRLQNLLRISEYPTRKSLLDEVISMKLLDIVHPKVRELFDLLELDKKFISQTSNIKKLLEELVEIDKGFSVYINHICQVALMRLMQHVSKIYSVIKIENLLKMMSFMSLVNDKILSSSHLMERYLINSCIMAGINILIDHEKGCLRVGADTYTQTTNSASYSLKSKNLRSHETNDPIINITKRLHAINVIIEHYVGKNYGFSPIQSAMERAKRLALTEAGLEADRKSAAEEKALISEKKILYGVQLKERIESSAREAEARRKVEDEILERERTRLGIAPAEEAVQKREEKFKPTPQVSPLTTPETVVTQRTISHLEDQEANRRLINTLTHELADLDHKKKLRLMVKRADYFERACNLEEIPYLEKDYELQKSREAARRKEVREEQIKFSKIIFESNIQMKKHLIPLEPYYTNFREDLDQQIEQARQEYEENVKAKIKSEVMARIKKYVSRKEEEEEIAKENERLANARRQKQKRDIEIREKEASEAELRRSEEAKKYEELGVSDRERLSKPPPVEKPKSKRQDIFGNAKPITGPPLTDIAPPKPPPVEKSTPRRQNIFGEAKPRTEPPLVDTPPPKTPVLEKPAPKLPPAEKPKPKRQNIFGEAKPITGPPLTDIAPTKPPPAEKPAPKRQNIFGEAKPTTGPPLVDEPLPRKPNAFASAKPTPAPPEIKAKPFAPRDQKRSNGRDPRLGKHGASFSPSDGSPYTGSQEIPVRTKELRNESQEGNMEDPDGDSSWRKSGPKRKGGSRSSRIKKPDEYKPRMSGAGDVVSDARKADPE